MTVSMAAAVSVRRTVFTWNPAPLSDEVALSILRPRTSGMVADGAPWLTVIVTWESFFTCRPGSGSWSTTLPASLASSVTSFLVTRRPASRRMALASASVLPITVGMAISPLLFPTPSSRLNR